MAAEKNGPVWSVSLLLKKKSRARRPGEFLHFVIMEQRVVDGWTLTLYGFRNHKCLYAKESYRRESFSGNVQPDFQLKNVTSVERCYDALGDPMAKLAIFIGHRHITIRDDAILHIKDASAWELVDSLFTLGEKLGLVLPAFALETEEACEIDQVLSWLEPILRGTLAAEEKLNLLKGKDIYSLLEDLAASKRRETDLARQIEEHQTIARELRSQLEEQAKAMLIVKDEYMRISTEKKELVAERAEFKKKMVDTVVATLGKM